MEIRITEGPMTIYDAKINTNVSFSCKAEGTEESPSWNINGSNYFITDLPPNYRFHQGKLKIAIITTKLNGTVLYCFYDIFPSGQIKSQNARLFLADKGWQSYVAKWHK